MENGDIKISGHSSLKENGIEKTLYIELFRVVEALIGLPVLSNFTGGAAHLFGTRGGFILAFLPLAFIVSYVSRLKNTLWNKVFACILGNIVLYTSGITWLSHFIGFEKAIQFGLQPFLLQIPVYIAVAVLFDKLIRTRN